MNNNAFLSKVFICLFCILYVLFVRDCRIGWKISWGKREEVDLDLELDGYFIFSDDSQKH